MHYIIIMVLATFAGIDVSALPLSRRGLVTADSIPHSADNLVKRNDYALPITQDTNYYARQILSSRAAEGSVVPDSVHVSRSVNQYVKRVTEDPDPTVTISVVIDPIESGGGQANVPVSLEAGLGKAVVDPGI